MSGLTLASTSPARAAILRAAGVAFETTAPGVDEAPLKAAALDRGATPLQVAAELAAAKALAVSAGCDGLVLGADQTLDLDGRLFDKPADLTAARAQLEALNGRAHRLHAALALAEAGVVVWSHVETAVMHVRRYSPAFLDGYVAAEGEALLGCVGAYRLEARGVQLFERIEGDTFTVLGLPLLPLLVALRRFGLAAE